MVRKSFRITNEQGIHARPATTLVKVAMEYESEITLSALKKTVDFKSIMGVMSLGIYSGTTIEIKCDGKDEEAALEALSKQIVELSLGKEI
ncbi:MAG: HPr family phosphocarrier protein [Acholeplasmatales bacterium]|nr:HPr family phosphocarrier protein [Acholeplasmatales bacterium]